MPTAGAVDTTTAVPPPLAILYEHPDWFRPLFDELSRRGVPHATLHAASQVFDPAATPPHALLLNRMSPSAWQRGSAHALAYTGELLAHYERAGARVINGSAAWRMETSKARQLALLAALGLPHPRSRVINDPALAPAAAAELGYPVIVKPNIGGSGAGVARYDTPAALAAAVGAGSLERGIDGVTLVQEYVPPRAGRITRVEVLDGRFLYAIRIYASGDEFNLCPADVCQDTGGATLERAACAVDAPKNGLRVEAYEPPSHVIDDVERIARHAGIEIGGVEYLIDDRDGGHRYYDINALSNFVADSPRVLGFDAFARLADWLERELAAVGEAARSAGRAAVKEVA